MIYIHLVMMMWFGKGNMTMALFRGTVPEWEVILASVITRDKHKNATAMSFMHEVWEHYAYV